MLGKVESLGGKSIFFKKSSLLLVSAGSKDQTFYAHSKNIYKCVLKIKAIFHNSVGGSLLWLRASLSHCVANPPMLPYCLQPPVFNTNLKCL